jgi:hypothetical protein
MTRHYLVASDFDQTLSFNDSGAVLGEIIGASSFGEKVAGLSEIHLVQPGAELAYLLRHDPDFRCVRREHLVQAGARVRLKRHVGRFVELLDRGLAGCRFSFRVISAAPRLVVQSALEGLVAPEQIFGTELDFDPVSGEICAITQVPAGYGKVAILDMLEARLGVSPSRTIYVGDGGSDLHVMLHVNARAGLTVAVSETKQITRVARRTVLSDTALSVLVPILEEVAGADAASIRDLFESHGLVLREWDKARTDWISVRDRPPGAAG